MIERLATEVRNQNRLSKVKGTCAQKLSLPYLGTIELLELTRISPAKVIYDIGAYRGTWALLAKSITNCNTIHAFEPLKKHLDYLYPGVQENQDIIFHNIALGCSPGFQEINITNKSDASSLLAPNADVSIQYGVEKVGQELVKVFPLDEYRKSHDLPWPNLIKLDVQGYELECLKGSFDCLNSATWVLCEVSFTKYYSNQPLFHEIAAFLNDFNFSVYAFAVDTPVGKPCHQTDVLFYRSH